MPRFYFDIRDGSRLCLDEEGLELPDLQAAKVEATHSLADLANDIKPDGHDADVSVHVRYNDEVVFRAGIVIDADGKGGK